MRTGEDTETALSEALAGLAHLEMEPPPGFEERVLAALDAGVAARRRAARLAVIRTRERVWHTGRHVAGAAGRAGRTRAVRAGALASSALVVGAVAILEARHLRRSRAAA